MGLTGFGLLVFVRSAKYGNSDRTNTVHITEEDQILPMNYSVLEDFCNYEILGKAWNAVKFRQQCKPQGQSPANK